MFIICIYFFLKFTATTPAIPERFGFIMIDMNGDKRPNTMCQDRYRFILYENRAILDPTTNCSMSL